jgi:hypothetical protein
MCNAAPTAAATVILVNEGAKALSETKHHTLKSASPRWFFSNCCSICFVLGDVVLPMLSLRVPSMGFCQQSYSPTGVFAPLLNPLNFNFAVNIFSDQSIPNTKVRKNTDEY